MEHTLSEIGKEKYDEIEDKVRETFPYVIESFASDLVTFTCGSFTQDELAYSDGDVAYFPKDLRDTADKIVEIIKEYI